MKENAIIGAIEQAAQDLAFASIKKPYEGQEMAYQVGIRQGKYQGLKEAVSIIVAILEDTAKKDKDL
jgi:hypothetical protein